MGNTMIKAPILFLLSFVLVAFTMNGQELPLTNAAAILCQDKQYDAALAKIEEAKLSKIESGFPYMWYVDGFIHKEIYKLNESGNRTSTQREMAVESFLKALELDKRNEQTAMTKLSLKFLASSYYNDALIQTREFDLTNEQEPELYFKKFRRLIHIAEPGTSLKKFDNEFNKSMGQRYFQLWQMNIENDLPAERATGKYNEVVRLDSTDSDAFYNIAVIYYNKAVFKYRKIGPDTDIFDLIMTQQDCAELIKNKALVNMQRAYKLNAENGEIVRGLMYIHRALEHENDVAYFKAEIERLVAEGKITLPQN